MTSNQQRNPRNSCAMLTLFSVLIVSSVTAFAPVRFAVNNYVSPSLSLLTPIQGSLATSRLAMVDISVTTPSQEEAETMGIREWPQQAKSKGSFGESCQEGQTLVRYVLDGQGHVQIASAEERKEVSMAPGSLLEVTGEATLSWKVTSDEMIILTPNFEQVGIFAGVALGLVVLVGALVATS